MTAVDLTILLFTSPHIEEVKRTLSNIELLHKKILYELIIFIPSHETALDNEIKKLKSNSPKQNIKLVKYTASSKGNLINEVLPKVHSQNLWIVSTIKTIDVNKICRGIEILQENIYPCLSTQSNLFFAQTDEWLQFILNREFPQDHDFLWNTSFLRSNKLFFNPFMNDYCCLELCLRSISLEQIGHIKTYATPYAMSPIDNHVFMEIVFTLRRCERLSVQEDMEITRSISPDSTPRTSKQPSLRRVDELYNRAYRAYEKNALDDAIEHINLALALDSKHIPSLELQATLFEMKRDFVQSIEVKHKIEKLRNSEKNNIHIYSEKDNKKNQVSKEWVKETPKIAHDNIKVSIIIITAGACKDILEECLQSMAQYLDDKTMELIVVDNGSIDDTLNFLNELEYHNFFNIQTIINNENLGYAKGVNQGLEIAKGKYICVMHNDITITDDIITKFLNAIDKHSNYILLGGKQVQEPFGEIAMCDNPTNKDIIEVAYISSECYFMKRDTSLRFNENYISAGFEMFDFCRQVSHQKMKIGIVPNITWEHLGGVLTHEFEIHLMNKLYWKNANLYINNWINVKKDEDILLQITDPIARLSKLGSLISLFYPNAIHEELYHKYISQEPFDTKKIETCDYNQLLSLALLFYALNDGVMLQKIEPYILNVDTPMEFVYLYAHYYYMQQQYAKSKQIIMQEKNWINHLPLQLLNFSMIDYAQDENKVIETLNQLFEQYPSNPILQYHGSIIHTRLNNQEEAELFYKRAQKLDPSGVSMTMYFSK